MPVDLSPRPEVCDRSLETQSTAIVRTVDPAFEERWAAWRARSTDTRLRYGGGYVSSPASGLISRSHAPADDLNRETLDRPWGQVLRAVNSCRCAIPGGRRRQWTHGATSLAGLTQSVRSYGRRTR
jgi:hypothetical protein